MAVEIERKFLVTGTEYRAGRAERIVQGYICSTAEKVVRVRKKGDEAFLTLKDATVGFARHEFEYRIPAPDAEVMLTEMCEQPLIDKTRWTLDHEGHLWEVDEFHGDNQGLVVAEIELENADETFTLPPWVGQEVTGDAKYYNARLYTHPYKNWENI